MDIMQGLHGEMPWYLKLNWCLYNLGTTTAIVITILYFGFLGLEIPTKITKVRGRGLRRSPARLLHNDLSGSHTQDTTNITQNNFNRQQDTREDTKQHYPSLTTAEYTRRIQQTSDNSKQQSTTRHNNTNNECSNNERRSRKTRLHLA
ncbi:hypothetical protein FSP39_014043 [Pinctada imbricata]|uniref:Uncharacterized protein n=1 Tax=Pinctada imbricata TaxID=66713 RepID=A0AA88YPA6_PINIB|nr:hypothetical protein FSP39_014043 [Pinctada imbricata]